MIDLSIPEISELLPHLTIDERKELFTILEQDAAVMMWRPLPGPQSMAYHSTADVLGYGGAAGGGKTDLMLGAAINRHRVSYILRREATQMQGIYNRMTEIMGGQDGFNKSDKIWRFADQRLIRFGSTPNLGDEMNYQGQARDLLGIDEAANFLEAQVRFLMGWVRTTVPGQRTQSILTFNPPTSAEGRWVVDFFAAWLDPKHPLPALTGELRWYASFDGKEHEWADGDSFMFKNELIIPQSRTFVPSRISDNPFLVKTNYMAQLQAMPEPLRSQMLYGDFQAGMSDDPWQVIPTRWVEDAQARWQKRQPKPEIVSLGVDVARGGKDQSVIAGVAADWWFDEIVELEGHETPNGPQLAGHVIANNPCHAPIHIDVIGVGASPYDYLAGANQQVYGINVAGGSLATDKSGRLTFKNLRSELVWKFRELLDPSNNHYPALPPGRDLLIELTSYKWRVQGAEIYVESREEIVKRIGKSPDKATALILAAIRTPKLLPAHLRAQETTRRDYDPFSRTGYDPFKGR